MATTYNLAITRNPNFNTVLGLTNTVFDRNNVRSGQMATEDQIQQLWQDIIRLEERIDYCCRDIVFWDIQVKIKDRYGNVMSDFLENRTTGIVRRGKNFTMKFPLKAVPKYEGDNYSSVSSEYTVDNDGLSCVTNNYTNNIIHDFCPLLYRGSSGEYFEMSTRNTRNCSPSLRNNIYSRNIDVNGNEMSAYTLPLNTLFAEVNDENDIFIKSLAPIDTQSQTKVYGRIFKFTLWDVTLGG